MRGEFVQSASDGEKDRDRCQPDEQRKFSADRAPERTPCFPPVELPPLFQTCGGAYRLRLSGAIKRCNLGAHANRDRPAKVPLYIYPPAIAPMIRNGFVPFAIASGSGASGDSCDKSSLHAKKRTIGLRAWVT